MPRLRLMLCGAVIATVYNGVVVAAGHQAADLPTDQWVMPGGSEAGNYFSNLADINASNVRALGFAWDYALNTTRGQEGTPLVVDGTLFASGNWGRVYAIDAETGRERWTFLPELDAKWGRFACCDVVNRGLAFSEGRIYVGALDGWLYALDSKTGRVLWKADTLVERDRGRPYTITGAPLIANDIVLIGNSGGDFAGFRGYVSAFDSKTGALRWRFYTVPRNPTQGVQDQPHLSAALRTWGSQHNWEAGSGGAVWDGMAYDAALGLIYVGTGNSAPYDIKADGPTHNDHLYTATIVAIHANDGSLAWYYQTTPGDRWDYDSNAKFVLADLELGHRTRQALMQANKNGFYYILDRTTGELLSAKPFTFVNWTRGIDPITHRPLPNRQADYTSGPRLIFPGQAGAHSWQPMAYDPRVRTAYIPVLEDPMVYIDTAQRPAGLVEGAFTVPGISPEDYDPESLKELMGPLPSLSMLAKQDGIQRAESRAVLRAFDPVHGRILWEQPSPTPWGGGVLATAGNLVFQGDALGQLSVFAANSGRLLRRLSLGTSIMAAPMTYKVHGRQFVALAAGYGGGPIYDPYPKESAAYRYGNAGRIIAFTLHGGEIPIPPLAADPPLPQLPPRPTQSSQIERGEVLYNRYCARCHVFGRGMLPDLRRMTAATHQIFYDIVLSGLFGSKGMARWDDVLSRQDAEAIHSYLVDQAWKAYGAPSP
jgi:quinohemoprotein ethanol dehydrogenase